MSECPSAPFLVAKFVIEGDGEGMKPVQPVLTIPPRLSDS